MKKRISVILIICVLLSTLFSCVQNPSNEPKGKVYFSFFDTETRIYSYANETEEDFITNTNMISNMLSEYHQLFDIYNEYDGINNLCTLNKNAGKEAVKLDKKLIDFLVYCKEIYDKTSGEVNVMMGSVLSLWHEKRENAEAADAELPDSAVLDEAGEHTNINALILDTENLTARILDKDAKIDVGALGKGYAAEMCAQRLEKFGVSSYVLNLGGNIRIIGTKPDGTGWVTGITNPIDSIEGYAAKINISDTSCVTSGDYERYYTVNGVRYHHIIDMDTLYPADYYTSITVITKDSSLADALSTALFCMTYDEGLRTLKSFDTQIEVLWIYKDGTKKMTEGFNALLSE